jgi:hypothetical protein
MRNSALTGTVALCTMLAQAAIVQGAAAQDRKSSEWFIIVKFADGSRDMYPGNQLFPGGNTRENCERFIEQARGTQSVPQDAQIECLDSSELDAPGSTLFSAPEPSK